ncbi:unnamed protein product [Callosobruchus maculatus]|uniref:Integrase p58-like C-terminal domain-containing protein n=1 Tax=Callosobruchus maculatus TaxID=64391 RepID=A0A653DGS6_CALMS|nr:unnamed protein product [Callosobruchus maculatus]
MFGCKPGDDVAGEDYVTNLRRRMDEAHEKVRHNIRTASDRMKMTYDVGSNETAYQPGDLVWLYNPQERRGLSPKLQSSWEGPYEVVMKINDVIYRIKKANGGKPRVVHFNRLAPFAGDNAEAQVRELQQLHPELNFEDFMATHNGTAKARDLRMSRGIASEFQRLFGQVDELKRQGGRVGQVLELRSDLRRLCYLISKEKSYQKPTYRTVWEALLDLREKLLTANVLKLAIPKLACGRDGLDWRIGRNMLEVLFRFTGIEILVCSWNLRGPTEHRTVDCFFYQTSGCKRGVLCPFRRERFGDETALRRGQSGTEAAWNDYREARKGFKKEWRQRKRTSWREFCGKIDPLPESAKLMKVLSREGREKIGSLKEEDGNWTTSSDESLELLLETHFPGEGTKYTATGPDADQAVHKMDYQMAEDVKGLDVILPWVRVIFRASLVLVHVPAIWREARIVFIPKPGKKDYTAAKSFKPISLTSFLMKTLERMHAYKKGTSTDTALHAPAEKVEKSMTRREVALAEFFDIDGAFDKAKTVTICSSLQARRASATLAALKATCGPRTRAPLVQECAERLEELARLKEVTLISVGLAIESTQERRQEGVQCLLISDEFGTRDDTGREGRKTRLEQTAVKTRANIQETVVDPEKKLKRHQDEAMAGSKSEQKLVVTRLEQRQSVSHTLNNQDQCISEIDTSQKNAEEQLATLHKHIKEQQVKDKMAREELQIHSEGKRGLAAIAPALLDKRSLVVAEPYPYDGKISWDVYFMQFENIARMNNWSNEEKACALTSMLKDSAAVQSLTKEVFVNSPIEIQEYVALRQLVEGIADTEVQRMVKLSSPISLQDAVTKALQIEADIKATRMTRRVRAVEQDAEAEVRATSFIPGTRGASFQRNRVRTSIERAEKFTCWRCGQKGHLRVGWRIQVDKIQADVEKADEYANKMKYMQDTINSMKEQFDRVIKNLVKKNEGSIANLQRQHGVAMRELRADKDRMKQLFASQKWRSMHFQSKFKTNRKNLLKKNEQHEVALRKLNKEVSALKGEIKRLKALNQLKKAERVCDQVKDENTMLKQKINQMEAECEFCKKNLDNAIDKVKRVGIKDESKLRERLAQLEAENKKLKTDLSGEVDDPKKRKKDLCKAR